MNELQPHEKNCILGPEEWDEAKLGAVAEKCRHYIVCHAGDTGILGGELPNAVRAYAALNDAEKFRVQVLLCAMPDLSVVAVCKRRTAFRFFPAIFAPLEAFNIGDADTAGDVFGRRAAALHRAIDRTR